MKRDTENKKKININKKIIVNLLIGLAFMSIVFSAILVQASLEAKSKTSHADMNNRTEEKVQESQQEDKEVLAVIKEVNTEQMEITVFDIDQQETLYLSYTGGSDIRDKYDQIIAMNQIEVGSMAEVFYQQKNSKLSKLQLSDQAWEYAGVNNFTINNSSKVMKVADTKYKYNDKIMVYDGETLIPITNLAEQDVLLLRGYEETIWSITVLKGHGTVTLDDYDSFLGGSITVGYEAMQRITDDLAITVREGSFNLTVENGEYSATKNITVYRNQETMVSLDGLGPEAVKKSRITFRITPLGADLFVDGDLTSYANPVEMSYGSHSIMVSLGGYTTFQGTLNVDEAGKTIKIVLPETGSNQDADVSVLDKSDGDDDWISDIEQEIDIEGDANEVTGSIVDEDRSIIVQNPVGASVYLNGKFIGISPCLADKVIGSQVFTFIKEGYETISYTVDIENDGLDTYLSFSDMIATDEFD